MMEPMAEGLVRLAEETATSEAGSVGAATITTEMLTPLVDGLTANIGVILPVGIAVLAIFLGIKFIPKLIKMFTH